MSSGWGRDTLRCNGIPKHRSAAPISPSCARPAGTARGRGPARNWATASNTRLPKGVWKRYPPPRPQVTASLPTMRFAQRTAEELGNRTRSQPGEALLDGFGGQPVVGQRIAMLRSPCAGLTFGVAVFHGLAGLVGERHIEFAVDVGHRADRISDQFSVVDIVELGRVVFRPSAVELFQTA